MEANEVGSKEQFKIVIWGWKGWKMNRWRRGIDLVDGANGSAKKDSHSVKGGERTR